MCIAEHVQDNQRYASSSSHDTRSSTRQDSARSSPCVSQQGYEPNALTSLLNTLLDALVEYPHPTPSPSQSTVSLASEMSATTTATEVESTSVLGLVPSPPPASGAIGAAAPFAPALTTPAADASSLGASVPLPLVTAAAGNTSSGATMADPSAGSTSATHHTDVHYASISRGAQMRGHAEHRAHLSSAVRGGQVNNDPLAYMDRPETAECEDDEFDSASHSRAPSPHRSHPDRGDTPNTAIHISTPAPLGQGALESASQQVRRLRNDIDSFASDTEQQAQLMSQDLLRRLESDGRTSPSLDEQHVLETRVQQLYEGAERRITSMRLRVQELEQLTAQAQQLSPHAPSRVPPKPRVTPLPTFSQYVAQRENRHSPAAATVPHQRTPTPLEQKHQPLRGASVHQSPYESVATTAVADPRSYSLMQYVLPTPFSVRTAVPQDYHQPIHPNIASQPLRPNPHYQPYASRPLEFAETFGHIPILPPMHNYGHAPILPPFSHYDQFGRDELYRGGYPQAPHGGGGGGGGSGGDGGGGPGRGSGAPPTLPYQPYQPAPQGPPAGGGGPPPAGPPAAALAPPAQPRRDEVLPTTSLDIDKASKVPKYSKKIGFENWHGAFSNFCSHHGVAEVLNRGSDFVDVPDRYEQLTPEERAIGAAQGRLKVVETDDTRGRFILDIARMSFAWQSLYHAFSDEPDILATITQVPSPNAFAAWTKVQTMLRPQTFFTGQLAETEFSTLEQQKNERMEVYVGRVGSAINRMTATIGEPSEYRKVYQFIRGISTFSQSRKEMLLQNAHLGYAAATNQAIQFEQQDRLATVQNRGKNPQGNHVDKHDAKCHNCGEAGHFIANCPKPKKPKGNTPGKQSKPSGKTNGNKQSGNKPTAPKDGGKMPHTPNATCGWCKSPGHTEAQCQQKASGRAKKTDALPVPGPVGNHVSLIDIMPSSSAAGVVPAFFSSHDDIVIDMILDTGATDSMFCSSVSMTDAKVLNTKGISTAGRDVLASPTQGDVRLYSGTGHVFNILGAYQHAFLNKNLLSVSQLVHLPSISKVVFDADGGRVFDSDGNVVLHAEEENGLYRVSLIQRGSGGSTGSLHAKVSDHDLYGRWHERLGHPGQQAMQRLITSGAVQGLEGVPVNKELKCSSCVEGKLARKPHSHQTPQEFLASAPLDRVHADLHGPLQQPTMEDYFYVLVIVDEYTGYNWLYLLKSKEGDQVRSHLMRWTELITRSYGKPPMEFHTDRGGEFINIELVNWWASRGTKDTTTMPYDPEHNGKAERLNRTLYETGRTSMIACQAPKVLWGYFVLAAGFIRNYTHCPRNGVKTARQLMLNLDSPSSVAFMHPLGCTVRVKLEPRERQHKYDSLTEPCALVGYLDKSGYRCMSAEGKVRDSRNVVFDDTDFEVMRRIREHVQATDDADEEDDFEFFGSLADRNELKLFQQMQKDQSDADRSILPSHEEEKTASPLIPSRPVRTRRPVMRYGMADPNDIGQALLVSMATDLEYLEDQLTLHAFGNEALDAAAEAQMARIKAGGSHLSAPPAARLAPAPAPANAPPAPAAAPLARKSKRKQAAPVAAQPPAKGAAIPDDARIAIDNVTKNFPYPLDRKKTNKHGAIVTPSQRCVGTTRKGMRCTAKTRNAHLCWNHLRSEMGLRIKPSAIGGRGLFATRDLAAGEEVSKYTGDILDSADIPNLRYPAHGGSLYVFGIRGGKELDAARTNTAPGRFVNDSHGKPHLSNNCDWRVNDRTKTVRIITTKPVKAGEE